VDEGGVVLPRFSTSDTVAMARNITRAAQEAGLTRYHLRKLRKLNGPQCGDQS
jgi:hypothetical protein